MEQDVKNSTRVCQIPPGFKKGLTLRLKPSPILMAVSLAFILTAAGLVYYWMLPKPLPITLHEDPVIGTPHAVIAIDGDADFSDTALLEGWPGDGSPENPFIIDGLDIDLGGGEEHCIMISNTRVSFTISNYSFSGWVGGINWEAGIYLENVTNGEIVHNTFWWTDCSIYLYSSYSNTVANNTCNGNDIGIYLRNSDSNTVVNNTCNTNEWGIRLRHSTSNTVVNNTCNGNDFGIYLRNSDSNTVATNTCSNNRIGIYFDDESEFNTVANNTCNSNGESGIYLDELDFNTVANNIIIPKGYYVVLLLIGLVAGITMLGAGWRMSKLSRGVSRGERS